MRAGRKNRDGTWDNENGPDLFFEDPVSYDDITVRVNGGHIAFTFEPADENKPTRMTWMRKSDVRIVAEYFTWLADRIDEG